MVKTFSNKIVDQIAVLGTLAIALLAEAVAGRDGSPSLVLLKESLTRCAFASTYHSSSLHTVNSWQRSETGQEQQRCAGRKKRDKE